MGYVSFKLFIFSNYALKLRNIKLGTLHWYIKESDVAARWMALATQTREMQFSL